MTDHVQVGIEPLAPADVLAVARREVPVALTEQALKAMRSSREVIDDLASDEGTPHYGVSTGSVSGRWRRRTFRPSGVRPCSGH